MSLKSWLHHLNLRSTRLIPKIPKSFYVFLLFLSIIGLAILRQSVSADAAQYSLIKIKQDAIKSGSNQEAWLEEAMGSNIVSSVRTLMGEVPDSILNGQVDPNNLTYIPGGAIGGTTQLISTLYNPPVSGIEYIAHVKDNFLGKPAYAQGVGFAGLTPLLNIWRAFRDVVYILASIIFIVISIMIILRVKINPQTVIGIQNMIPQIVFTLILVTFSYAIAGLLIDLIYFVQGFFIAILFKAEGIDLGENLYKTTAFETIRQSISRAIGIDKYDHVYKFDNLSNPGLFQYYELVKAVIPTGYLVLLGTVIGAFFGTIIGALAGVKGAVGGFIGGLVTGGALMILIFQIIVLVSLFKFFLGVVKAYIIVILKVIIAPLEIGAGAFPNSKLNFSSWLNDIVAHLAIFPISVIYIIILNLIVRNGGMLTTDLWAPSTLSVANTFNLVPALIGFGGVLMLARLPELIPQLIFQIKPSPWGNAIGQTFKEVSTPFKAGGNLYLQNRANAETERYGSSIAHSSNDVLKHSFWDMLGNFGVIKRKS